MWSVLKLLSNIWNADLWLGLLPIPAVIGENTQDRTPGHHRGHNHIHTSGQFRLLCLSFEKQNPQHKLTQMCRHRKDPSNPIWESNPGKQRIWNKNRKYSLWVCQTQLAVEVIPANTTTMKQDESLICPENLEKQQSRPNCLPCLSKPLHKADMSQSKRTVM